VPIVRRLMTAFSLRGFEPGKVIWGRVYQRPEEALEDVGIESRGGLTSQ
jgi:hypothetical protein